MVSYRSKLFRFMLRNKHLLAGQIKRPVVDFNTSIEKLREDVQKSAVIVFAGDSGVSH